MQALFKVSTVFGYPIGMAIFGPLSDKVGRRVCLIATAVLTSFGAVGCTCSWSPWVTIAFRFITGIGAGGEYPLASVHVAEGGQRESATKNVGFLYVFGSGGGQALCPLVALVLLSIFPTDPKGVTAPDNETHNQIIWRGTFAVAAVMSLIGLVLRIVTTKDADSFERQKLTTPCSLLSKYWRPLLATSLGWFFYDVVEYGLKNNDVDLFSKTGSINHALLTSFLNLLISIVFLLVSALTVTPLSTKYAQLLGFCALSLIMSYMATFSKEQQQDQKTLFRALYIIQTGFQAFPGITTFATPADIFPNAVRGTCHGISSFSGKLGAIFGTYYFATVNDDDYHGIMSDHPTQYIFILAVIASVCGAVVSVFLTPRYTGQSLVAMDAEIEKDDHDAALKILYGGVPKVAVADEKGPETSLMKQ